MQPLTEAVFQALWIGTAIAAIPLAAAALVGTITAVLQSATQIQDQTLSFVPKLAAMAATIGMLASWAAELLTDLTRQTLSGGW